MRVPERLVLGDVSDLGSGGCDSERSNGCGRGVCAFERAFDGAVREAVRGARIVFHPHRTGSDLTGTRMTQWGAASVPCYEKAMVMRSMENTIYFASVNYALRYHESATSLIAPSGRCQAYLPLPRAPSRPSTVGTLALALAGPDRGHAASDSGRRPAAPGPRTGATSCAPPGTGGTA